MLESSKFEKVRSCSVPSNYFRSNLFRLVLPVNLILCFLIVCFLVLNFLTGAKRSRVKLHDPILGKLFWFFAV